MSDQRITVQIDELILHGATADGDRVAAALQRELVRLLGERGLPAGLQSNVEIAGLDGGAISSPPDTGPEALGADTARAVYGGLER